MLSKIARSAFAGLSMLRAPSVKSLGKLPTYQFASIDKLSKAQSRLLKAVERESKYEEENYETDASVQEFLEEHQFTLKDNEGSIALELQKDCGDYKIQIVFQSRSPQTDEPQEEGEEGENQPAQAQPEGQEEEGEQNQTQDYCDFLVYIVKANGKAVAYDCSSFDSEIQVNGVTVVDDVEQHKLGNRYERITTQYNGPDFNTLDERLQTSLVEFLKTAGVTEEVAAFIEHVSLDKEQRLYMSWLKNVKTFLA